jgi:hypothetical protein
VHSKDFARVLLPGCDGVGGYVDIEEFDGAVAAGCEELVFVRFGPGAVEERVLGVEPGVVLVACESAWSLLRWIKSKLICTTSQLLCHSP